MRTIRFFILVVIISFSSASGMGVQTSEGAVAESHRGLGELIDSPHTVGQCIEISWPAVVGNMTVTGNRHVKVVPGGRIDVAAGCTLTFAEDSSFDAGDHIAFGGDGKVRGLKSARVAWWGKSAAAINNALEAAAGGVVDVSPNTSYDAEANIDIPPNTHLRGSTPRTSKIIKKFSGDLVTMGDGAMLSGIWLDGNGEGYSGGGISLLGSDGRQKVFQCLVTQTDGPALHFTTTTCGSQSSFIDCTFSRFNALTGSGRYAVVMYEDFLNRAVPRKFANIETNGTPAFYFGGANNVYVTGSFIGDIAFTPNSRAVCISSSRIANQAELTLDGHNNSIIGCDISPKITIAPGASDNVIGPNSYNRLPVVDNSGNNRNLIYHWTVPYLPVMSSGGIPPMLGNGSIRGYYSMNGSIVTATINLTLGTTTRLGTGAIRFSLPSPHTTNDVVYAGVAGLYIRGVSYTAVCQIPNSSNYVTLIHDKTGSVTLNSPAVFKPGDTIRLSVIYSK